MGPDRNPDSMPSDGWGLYHPPEYYYYMDPPSTTTTAATTDCTYDVGILVNSKSDILITSTDFVLKFYPVYLEVLGT